MSETEALDPIQELELQFIARQKPMHEATARGNSAIQQFYNGQNVFVTGGSGFLGKQLIEKLFRATNVSKVFVLLRPKKGKAVELRMNELLQDPVFDWVKEHRPKVLNKIVPVAGDVAEIKLGISDKDWKTLTEEVNIIFHMAATTRFDETLRVATMINVRGAKEALVLGKACKQLKSYVHVSTAYSYACDNLIDTEVLEDFYKSPIDPDTLIKMTETVDEDRLNSITPSLIKNWPNTYSFGKAVAEETVKNMCEGLPLCVVRPAIVISAVKEPSPGWLDMSNVYGASGIILGPGIGLMHSFMARDDIHIGLVPVDYVNNAILAAAWETARRVAAGHTTPKIYTVTASTRNPTEWGYLVHVMTKEIRKDYSTPAAVGWGFVWQTQYPLVFLIYSWILHLIPGHIIDGIFALLGKERRFVKIYKKMYNMCSALSYFTTNQWRFVDDNTASLYDSLSPIDKEIFDFDICKINWREYMYIWSIGLRKFIIKDGLKGTIYARKKQIVFKILTFIIMPLYLFALYKVFSFFVVTSLYILGYVLHALGL
ncbi:unnamed protein product [Spodoptera littoralis]|uniref:Fatty acyl-CoA reductase n=1 Tax=Spodoptera littoralis TaxID=7109 RepID=A0A9P0I959_SPOLI|nr:unnamed protein product [Spodoptera littoralis]CAH1642342.1 unnamed protein product [Spodoptera littoralis]